MAVGARGTVQRNTLRDALSLKRSPLEILRYNTYSLQKETKEDCDQWTLFFVAASSASCLAFSERGER